MIPSPLLLCSASSMIINFSACSALVLPRTNYYHHILSRRRHNNSLLSPPSPSPSLLFATTDNDNDQAATSPENRAGSYYIDLGTITSSNEEASSYNKNDSFLQNLFDKSHLLDNNDPITPTLPSSTNNNDDNDNDISQWRSKHWIVLIDDEPSIRLAIGDYLHSMGYSVITACDGPQSFLDVLLYSCGWSLVMNDDSDDNDDDSDEKGRSAVPPPWIDSETSSMMLWRLPNCIISDIRMPGGVDGVQLLELLRQHNDVDVDDDTTNSSDSNEDDVVKKGRRRSSKKDQRIRSTNEYDGKDDFELLDAIVGSSSSKNNDGRSPTATGAIGKQSQRSNQDGAGKIVTAMDQAKQKLAVIRDTLSYHREEEASSNNNNNNLNNNNSIHHHQQQQQQYPTSLLQIPVILLTAKAMVSDRIVGFKAGANNYLPKPFRPEELLGMVDGLLKKQERERKVWRNRNALVGGGSKMEEEDDGKYADEQLAMMYSASAQQIKDLTTELVEIKTILNEEAQREINIKLEQEEMERLTKLLPNALWMFLNNDRRKNRLFTKDHFRSILLFCFNDASLVRWRKSTVTRDELLEELERLNDEDPDILKNFLDDR